jgi:hypothetical protein
MRPRRFVFRLAILAALALLATSGNICAQGSKKFRHLTFHRYGGEVHLSVPGNAQLIQLSARTDIKVKELSSVSVITNAGWAEYVLDHRLELYQNSDTNVTFERAEPAGRGTLLRLTLEQGTCAFYAVPGRNNTILLQAGGIEVLVSRRAHFQIEANADSARVTVYDGKVQVTSPDGVREVSKGYYLAYRVGTFTRLVLSKPLARPAASSQPSPINVSFSFSTFDLFDFYDYSSCGFGYGNDYYCYGLYSGVNECRYPTNSGSAHHYPHHPPHPPNAPPTNPPSIATSVGTLPRDAGAPRKLFIDAVTVAAQRQVDRPRSSGGTTMAALPKHAASSPDVLGVSVARTALREDAWTARQNTPLADRVDVAAIPRTHASARGDNGSRFSGAGEFRYNSGSSSGSSGSSGSGQQASSSGPAPSSSGGSVSVSPSAPAAAPAAPAAPAPGPAPRAGKPDM